MSNWMWIGVGLVIVGDIGWPTASPDIDRRRRRKGAQDEKVRLRGETNINKKFGLVVFQNSRRRRGDTR